MNKLKFTRDPYYDYDINRYSGIAAALRAARRKAKFRQEDLSQEIGVGRSRLAQWETGKRKIPMADWYRLVKALPDLANLNVRPAYSRHHKNVARLEIGHK